MDQDYIQWTDEDEQETYYQAEFEYLKTESKEILNDLYFCLHPEFQNINF